MASILYFVPRPEVERVSKGGGNTLAKQHLAPLGLGHIVDGGLAAPGCLRGPDGGQGVCLIPEPAPGADSPRLGYHADGQHWQKADGFPWWIGWEEDRPPRPADLARREQILGHRLRMADGQEWLVPTSREFPRRAVLKAGEWATGDVEGRAAGLWQAARDVIDRISSGDRARVPTLSEMFEFSCVALGINYRIGREEVSALKLLGWGDYNEVFDAVMGDPGASRRAAAAERAAKAAPGAET